MGKRKRRYDEDPWLIREAGGAPYWLIIAGGIAIIAIVLFVAIRALG